MSLQEEKKEEVKAEREESKQENTETAAVTDLQAGDEAKSEKKKAAPTNGNQTLAPLVIVDLTMPSRARE